MSSIARLAFSPCYKFKTPVSGHTIDGQGNGFSCEAMHGSELLLILFLSL